MQRGTNLGRLGDFNQAVIFDSIRRAPDGVSRVELASSTGLSPQTISNVVRRLLDNGFAREDRTVISGPGKPRTVLELEPDRLLAVGVHLDPAQMTVVLVNLRGHVLGSRRFADHDIDSPQATIGVMGDTIDELIRDSGQRRDHIVGVGVAAPGPIDPDAGVIVTPPLMGGDWRSVEIVEPLMERLQLSVMLEKDSVAAAIAEQWNGDQDRDRNFLSVYIGTGVGIGAVLGGEVLRGVSNNAGEIGNVVVPVPVPGSDTPVARTFGDAVSHESMLDLARAAGVDCRELEGADTVGQRSQFLGTMVRRARDGDTAALEVLTRLNGIWSSLVAQLANVYDVDKVFLGGPVWSEASSLLIEDAREAIQSQFLMSSVHRLDVETSSLGHHLGAIGGACAVLDAALSPKASALLLG
ncbi:ROK family transcriptional regulator [Zhihengliuella sp.]|uniref:ROK family transcriptional regulator n=1 Tax=Zhihengliuella sp. TaxID=1954483 RepID=UPI002812125C|nr:ROK family transcriptional regulator [Zhihengliuella sp.]